MAGTFRSFASTTAQGGDASPRSGGSDVPVVRLTTPFPSPEPDLREAPCGTPGPVTPGIDEADELTEELRKPTGSPVR